MEERPGEPGSSLLYEEPETRPVGRRMFLLRALAWLPMAFFAACLVIALLAQPLTRAVQPVPVTGRGLPAAPTLTPGPTREPVMAPPLAPGLSYKEAVSSRIYECTMAFHEFFILERMASHRPEMISSDSWRDEARVAMDDFRAGCAPLGALPSAPTAYTEVDRWLKLAAGEVDSASERFDAMIAGNDAAQIEVIAVHMMNFLEYTHNAEQIIDRLEERKEI